MSSEPVDKTALVSLLEDFKTIPQTLDQSTLVTAYSLINQNEQATQKEVNEAVAALKDLKESIYATPMSFIDGGLEPHVRIALGFDEDTPITIGDCLTLEELDCTYDKNLGAKMRVSYDFRYFPNLKSLNLSGNSVEDLAGFAYLSQLETLSLADNPARSSTLSEDDEEDIRSLDILGKLPLKTLDLSGKSVILSFSALPVMLRLESLDISENSLESLDAIGTKCPNLKTLVATDCKISNLSDLSFCSQLVSLDLSRIQRVDLTFFESLKTLENLTLDGVSLSDYEVLTKVTQLISLSLSGCDISNLSWISGFTLLQQLDLSENEISDPTLPAGKTSVKKLNLSGNKIDSFTLTDALSDVEELNLSENGLTSFSVSVSGGECGLKVLDLSSNALSSFSLGNASKLESADLSDNELETLALSSKSLLSLSLSDNPLEGLILNLPSLASLELACETEYTEPVSLNLPALKLLDLSKESTSKTDLLSSLPGLETLSVHLSGVSSDSIARLTSLKTLTVYGGDDDSLSFLAKLPALETLTISHSSVTAPSVTGLETLKSLHFESCSKLADVSGISFLPALEAFSVIGGNLSAPALKDFPALRTVTLSDCDLTSVSYLTNLPMLTTLNLSKNGFKTIEVLGFSHLQYLDLSDNKLETTQAITLDLTKGTLDLSGNEEDLYKDMSAHPDTLNVLTD